MLLTVGAPGEVMAQLVQVSFAGCDQDWPLDTTPGLAPPLASAATHSS